LVISFLRKIQATYLLAVIFLSMFLAGLLSGGFGKVLANGIVICLDCIGLI